jgi:ribonuclease HII
MARPKTRLELPKQPTLEFELALWARGVEWVAGLDEAGRGAWSGPVCAGAVTLPHDPAVLERLSGVRDSKQMSRKARDVWAGRIRAEAMGWGVGFASNEEIDALGILPATRLAMERALVQCETGVNPQHLLIDAVRLPGVAIAQTALIKGDARVLSIAAASVLAKTARAQVMTELDALYPGYGFALHKGYGTKTHQEALLRLGPCAAHRRSFAPVRILI